MPGRGFRRGVAQHVIDGGLIERPFLAVSPIFVGEFPLLFGRSLSGAEAFQLFVLTDLNPEFDEERAAVLEIGFKFVDFPIGAFPVRLAAEALNPLHEDAAIPGAIEDCNVAALREPLIEAPEEVAALFFGCGTRNRQHSIAAGVAGRRGA